jgi:hypothetical protein
MTLEAGNGSEGSAVTVTAGGSFTLVDGSDEGAYIVIAVTAASLPTESCSDIILIGQRHETVMDAVSAAKALTGMNKRRCLGLRNVSGGALAGVAVALVTDVFPAVTLSLDYAAAGAVTVNVMQDLDAAGWPDSGCFLNDDSSEVLFYFSRSRYSFTVPAAGRAFLGTVAAAGTAGDAVKWRPAAQIGIEAPSAQPDGNFTLIANEEADPGCAWGDTGNIGALANGNIYGLWIQFVAPVGAPAEGFHFAGIEVTWTGTGHETIRFWLTIENASGFRIYKNTTSGGEVDYSTPYASPATLPYTSGVLTTSFKHRFAIRRFSGVFTSLDTQEFDVELSGAGAQILRPSSPFGLDAVAEDGGDITITAIYQGEDDPAFATIFRLCYDNGTGTMDWNTPLDSSVGVVGKFLAASKQVWIEFTVAGAGLVDATAYKFGILAEVLATGAQSEGRDTVTATCDKVGPGEVQNLSTGGGA